MAFKLCFGLLTSSSKCDVTGSMANNTFISFLHVLSSQVLVQLLTHNCLNIWTWLFQASGNCNEVSSRLRGRTFQIQKCASV